MSITTMDPAALEMQTPEKVDDSKSNSTSLPTDIEQSATDVPPADKGKGAWMFVLSAFLLEVSIWGFATSYGVFQQWYTSSLSSPFIEASPSAISAVGTVSLCVSYMARAPLVPLFQKYRRKSKIILWCTLAVWTGSLVVSSFTTQIWQLILLQGVVCGFAGALLYIPVELWLPEWFVKRRGLATGIIYAGSGVGGLAFPLLLGVSLQNLGFRWTLRIWACSMGAAAAVALWYLNPRVPVHSTRQEEDLDYSFIRTPLFFILNMIILVQGLAYFPVSLYLPTFTSDMSFANLDGQLVLAVLNIAMIIGQIVFGYMCDKMPYTYVIVISALGSSVASYLLWGFSYNVGMIFAFVSLFGALGGGFNSSMPLAATDVAGEKPATIGLVLSIYFSVAGLSAVIGPVIAGSLYTSGQNHLFSSYGPAGFGKAILFVGSMMGLSAAFSICATIVSAVRKRRQRD